MAGTSGAIAIADDGEDQPWSPSSVIFTLIAAQLAQIRKESIICDLGAGGAVSAIAVAVRTGAKIYAVDSSRVAVEAILNRAKAYDVEGQVEPVHMEALAYLEQARGAGMLFDLVLAEGGLCGALGHHTLLRSLRSSVVTGGYISLSGYTYRGVSRQPWQTNQISDHVPLDVREFYENSMHCQQRREILNEHQLLDAIRAERFAVRFNCCASQTHWSAYYDRVHRMADKERDVALQISSAARRFGIGEAFHNFRGQKYLSYSIVIAQSTDGVNEIGLGGERAH